jgi:hypothetical protein
MKANKFIWNRGERQKNKVVRKPISTLGELSRDTGTPSSTLHRWMVKSTDMPSIHVEFGSRKYYIRDELLAWYARRAKGDK